MKKILFALSTIAALLVVGCSKENVETSAPEYKLVVNMDKSSFGDGTRAPRSSWKDGDEVYVLFNGDLTLESTEAKYLKLTYSDATWTPTWVGTTLADVAAKGSGNLLAGYVDGTVATPSVYVGTREPKYASLSLTDMSHEGLCVMICENGTYEVDGNAVTLNIEMKPVVNQITITNISAEDGYWLFISDIQNRSADGVFFRFDNSGLSVSSSTYSSDGSYRGYANEDGVAYFFTSIETNATSLTLTLRGFDENNTLLEFSKSVSGATGIDFSANGKSIKVVGPSGTEGEALNGWTLAK